MYAPGDRQVSRGRTLLASRRVLPVQIGARPVHHQNVGGVTAQIVDRLQWTRGWVECMDWGIPA